MIQGKPKKFWNVDYMVYGSGFFLHGLDNRISVWIVTKHWRFPSEKKEKKPFLLWISTWRKILQGRENSFLVYFPLLPPPLVNFLKGEKKIFGLLIWSHQSWANASYINNRKESEQASDMDEE